MFHRNWRLGLALLVAFPFAGPLATVQAQHGGWSFGGGGMRFGGGWGGGYGGGHQYRQNYGHHNYNYNQGYGHNRNYGGHQYYQPQPQRQYVQPRTTSVPQRTYVAPKTNVVPKKSTLAPANKTAVAKTTPKTNVVPAPNKLAPASKVTSNQLPTAPSTAVRPTTKTTQPPRTVKRTVPNPGKGNLVANLTQADLDRIAQQIDRHDELLLDRLDQATTTGLDRLIDRLPGADGLTDDQRRALRDAVANGDPDRVRELLGEAATSPAGMELIDRATAGDVIDAIQDAIADGNIDGGDLANLLDAINDLDVPNLPDLIALIGQIGVDQQVVIWVDATDPGMGVVPFGPDVPLVLVPGLPPGLLMPLDDGVVMIGMGDPGDGILLGMGDPLTVAGLPVPIDGAEPAAAATGSFTSGQIVINNPTPDTVNYTLNQQPFSMGTDFEQTLEAGTTWTIEFDRGGGFGMARYVLSEGYYVFTATDRGWELYKRSFRSTLDNSNNTFAFNYVVDDQQQVLNPGESQELSGLFPPVLRFDNGNGTELQRRLDSGSYRVALADDLTMDIYRAEDVVVPAAPAPAAASPLVAAAPAPGAPAAPTAKQPATTGRAPAPQPMPAAPTQSVTARATTGAAATGRRLPAGFTLFDPVAALTDSRAARRLPASFTLFRDAARQIPVAAPR